MLFIFTLLLISIKGISISTNKKRGEQLSKTFNHDSQKITNNNKKIETKAVTFQVNPDFKSNPEVTFEIYSNQIKFLNSTNNTFNEHFFNKYNDNIIIIKDEKETNNNENKIIIKPTASLTEINVKTIYIEITNCDQIHIQFSEWDSDNLPEVMFVFLSENVNDLTFTSSKNKKIKYQHQNLTSKDLFDEYPTAFAFCLTPAKCIPDDYQGLDPIVINVDSTDQIANQFDETTKKTLKNLIFFLSKEENSPDVELNLSILTGEKLEHVKFISSKYNTNIKLTNLPQKDGYEWNITNCSIEIESKSSYTIKELISNYSKITGDGLSVNHGVYLMNADLIDNNINVNISDESFFLNEDKYNSNDIITLKFKSNKDSKHYFIFESQNPNKINSYCSFNIEAVDENSTEIPVLFSDNIAGSIQINVSSNEHIIISSIPKTVDFTVYSNELHRNIQQIRKNPSSIGLCFLSGECESQSDFSIDHDSTFISTKIEENYHNIVEQIKNSDYKCDFIRLVFFGKNNEAINFNLNEIPSDKFNQIQLYGYNDAQIRLNDDSRTTNFDNWVVCRISFVKNTNINYTFNELTIIDSDTVFLDSDSYSDKITILKARFHCRQNYKINSLESLMHKINEVTYDLFPELDSADYVLSARSNNLIPNSNLENGNGSPMIYPGNYNFFVHAPKEPIDDNYKFYICRYDNNFDKISITFEKIVDNFTVQYECKTEKEQEKYFVYNFITLDGKNITSHQGNCTNIQTNLNENQALPTQIPLPTLGNSTESFTPSQIFTCSSDFTMTKSFVKSDEFTSSKSFSYIHSPTSEFTPSFPFQPKDENNNFIESDSKHFTMTSFGFYNETNQDQGNFENSNEPYVTVRFNSKEINITESDEYKEKTVIYFAANQPNSMIRIKNVKNSTIGIDTTNSPTVILDNSESSLNIMNNIRGYSTMEIVYEGEENLFLNELNNNKGYLTLNVQRSYDFISFSSLLMSRISSFEVRNLNKNTNAQLLEDDDNDNIAVKVEDNINISSKSNVILTKIDLQRRLFIYDDSTLTFKDETTFSNESVIEILFQNSEESRQQPIINFNGLLETTPSKVLLTFDDKSKKENIENYILFEASNFKSCLNWIDKLQFTNKDKRKIEASCQYADGGLTHFIFSAKKDNKLNTGAIVGIVIACIAVVAIIVAVIIIVVKRKNKGTEIAHEVSDDSTF